MHSTVHVIHWLNVQCLTKCAMFDQMVNSDAHLVKCINKTVAKCSVIIKTKPFKTKTKTWPLTTKLTQQLKDRDTNTIIPNLYISGDIKMLNMLVKYSAWSTARDLHNVRAATVYWKTSTLSIKSNHSLHLQLSWYSVQCPCSHILVVQLSKCLLHFKNTRWDRPNTDSPSLVRCGLINR